MSTQISRRTLAKALAASGTVAGLARVVAQSPVVDSPVTKGWGQVHPGVWRATIGTPERFTPVSSRLVPPQTEAFARLPRVDAAPLPPIEGKQTARGCLIQLPLRADEQIFGLGLQFVSFAQRGKKKVVRVNADPKVDTGDSHAPVPFYVTTEGVGILIDTARYATFYFADTCPKPAEAAPVVAESNPDPNYTHTVPEDDSSKIIVEVPRTSGVDVYLFAGPAMQDAVKRYNVFSGGGFVPPEWGLGFWYRTAARANHKDVLAIAQELRERKVPCDVVGLEPGWQSHAYSCTFVWDQDRFPEPKGFVRSATDLHYKINLWEHAFTNPASPLFTEIEPYSGNFGVWNGLVPDFAGAQARKAFGSYHGKNLIDLGVSGFKLDECDNSDFTGGWSFPECSSFPSGVDGEQMHNVFGLRYQMAIWDQYRQRGKETYGLVRSSGPLAAPYPFVLYSDLYDHRVFIRALVNSGFCGLLWCPEVRQTESEEDLIRRLQSVVFSPLAQVDCWYMKNPPWKQTNRALNNNDQFLDQWQVLESRCREIIGWRMQLVPYLTAAFQRYADDGTPPFRALVLDTPEDKRLHQVDDQYLIGDRMMVAPLFAGEGSRKVVIPEGVWQDFWTGSLIQGGNEISIPSSTKNIPVYVKAGSVIPWAGAGMFAGAPETRQISVRVYGDGSIPFSMRCPNGNLSLSWRGRDGRAGSEGSGYRIDRWDVIG
ncbi:MAG TPA: TIM-barrel domain-containing protein [Acidobacteriaceae bacterium]|nr:TIM-barrel domain-containing protein [Acidobacteriaceae bacterium]